NKYLTSLFGPKWIDQLKVEKETETDANGNEYSSYTAVFGPERLAVDVERQQPLADAISSSGNMHREKEVDDDGMHYGIASVEGFSITAASRDQQTAAIGNILE